MTEYESRRLAAIKNHEVMNNDNKMDIGLSYIPAKQYPGKDAPWMVLVYGPFGSLVKEIKELTDV